jgi:hypothetical protein
MCLYKHTRRERSSSNAATVGRAGCLLKHTLALSLSALHFAQSRALLHEKVGLV